MMKILELCPFSSGICGVFTRVLSESKEFHKLGYEVMIFSSDIEKGTGKRNSTLKESKDGIKIRRFRSSNKFIDNLLSSNVQYWFGKEAVKELLEYDPDIIITHLIHPHSTQISKLSTKLKTKNPAIKLILVPHAPFNVNRPFPLNLATTMWRKIFARNLNNFDKVVAITNWEIPYLKQLGINENKIVYIPNGLPEEYFAIPIRKGNLSKVLFLGRIAPVKDLETLVRIAKRTPKRHFSLVGSAEPQYEKKMCALIALTPNVSIHPPIFNLKEKIKLIDEHAYFILPSVREAMPQVLLEAMARGRIVISSDTDGGKEIIRNRKTGLLFPIGDDKLASDLLNYSSSKLGSTARKEARNFKWTKLIKKYELIFK